MQDDLFTPAPPAPTPIAAAGEHRKGGKDAYAFTAPPCGAPPAAAAAEQKADVQTVLQTPELVGKEAAWLAKRHNARCVIVLCCGDVSGFSVHSGEDAAKLHRDLIIMADNIRKIMEARNAKG